MAVVPGAADMVLPATGCFIVAILDSFYDRVLLAKHFTE